MRKEGEKEKYIIVEKMQAGKRGKEGKKGEEKGRTENIEKEEERDKK